MFYEKFIMDKSKENSSQSQNPSLESINTNSQHDSETSIEILNGIESILDEFYNCNLLKVPELKLNYLYGFEEDTPFDGLAPEDENTNDNQNSDQSPFDNLTDEQDIALDTNDPFSDNGLNDEQQNQSIKPGNQIEVSRQELLQASYDLPTSIRKIFPKRLLELKEVINNNISAVEKLSGYINDEDGIVNSFIASYTKQIQLIDNYLSIITERTYDDIFKFYTIVHTNCIKIKDSYQTILDELFPDKKTFKKSA